MGDVRGPRVAIHVTPRLLSDAVSRALIDQGLEVVIQPDEQTVEDCDAVVTSQTLPSEDAGVVVTVLPGGRVADREAAGESVRTDPARVRNLNELVAAIRAFIDTVAIS